MRKKKVVMDIISGQNNIHKRWEHDPTSLQELHQQSLLVS